MGNVERIEAPGGLITTKRYLGGKVIVTTTSANPTPVEVLVLTDHLGSTYALVNRDTGYTLNQGMSLVDPDSGLKYGVYGNASGHKIVAFGGTDGVSLRDWTTNIRQAFGLKTSQYQTALVVAQDLKGAFGIGNLHFVGHSLGGGLAAAAATITGGTATIFNAAAVHPNTVGGAIPQAGSIVHFRSAYDMLQPVNAISAARVYGEQISAGRAGLHGQHQLCRAMGGCK